MLKLERIKDATRAPRSDLNVEVGHAYWQGQDFPIRFKTDFQKSMKLFSELGFENGTDRVAISVLIDDKRLAPNDRLSWFEKQSSACFEEFLLVDYIVFESELKTLLRSLYANLKPAKKNQIQIDIERYVRTKTKTACSHDIAIWHAMRAGILGSKKLPIYKIVGKPNSAKLLPSFHAPRIVSILNQSDREHEENAETDILRNIRSDIFDWQGIERNYYY